LQNAEVLIPRSSGRYSWPHELLQEHLSAQLSERPDKERFYRAAAAALLTHPQANTRRIVRQRVVNLIQASDHDPAALLLFDFLQRGWNGAREPLATLADLDLLKGKLTGRMLALKNRWQAEAMRHVGRLAEASTLAELARTRFEEAGDDENVAHCLRLQGHLLSEQGSSAEGLELVKKALHAFVSAFTWLDQLERGTIPNAENVVTYRERVAACLNEIRSAHDGKTVAIFCHGGVIRMMLSVLLDLPLPRMSAFEIDYASVTEIELKPHRVEIQFLNLTPWRDLNHSSPV
jgi:hypothetical protein